MQVMQLPENYQHLSPAGAQVRVLLENNMGGTAHCTLPQGTISKPVCHKTVSEIWYVISGQGEVWRKNDNQESITPLKAGVCIDLPLGTYFQYRSNQETLVFLCVTMPPWPGSDEIIYLTEGAWEPN